jgi:hypothetical protein
MATNNIEIETRILSETIKKLKSVAKNYTEVLR